MPDERDNGTMCGYCGRRYKVDVMIEDKLWERIAPDTNLLCGECIMRRIEVSMDYRAYRLIEIP